MSAGMRHYAHTRHRWLSRAQADAVSRALAWHPVSWGTHNVAHYAYREAVRLAVERELTVGNATVSWPTLSAEHRQHARSAYVRLHGDMRDLVDRGGGNGALIGRAALSVLARSPAPADVTSSTSKP